MSRLLIKGGRIVTAVDDYPGDVLVEGEKVSAIFAHGHDARDRRARPRRDRASS